MRRIRSLASPRRQRELPVETKPREKRERRGRQRGEMLSTASRAMSSHNSLLLVYICHLEEIDDVPFFISSVVALINTIRNTRTANSIHCLSPGHPASRTVVSPARPSVASWSLAGGARPAAAELCRPRGSPHPLRTSPGTPLVCARTPSPFGVSRFQSSRTVRAWGDRGRRSAGKEGGGGEHCDGL